MGTQGPQNYIDSETPSPNLHRCGDPFVGLGTSIYICVEWGPRPQFYTDMETPIPISMVDMETPDYIKPLCCAIAMAMPNCINNVKSTYLAIYVARNLKSGRKSHSRKLLQTNCSSQMDIFRNSWSSITSLGVAGVVFFSSQE